MASTMYRNYTRVQVRSGVKRGVKARVKVRGERLLSPPAGASLPRTMSIVAFDRITADPNRMGGVPCIRDLRVTVSMVLGRLAGGSSVDELLADYPYLEREDIYAALEFAAAMVNEHEVSLARPA